MKARSPAVQPLLTTMAPFERRDASQTNAHGGLLDHPMKRLSWVLKRLRGDQGTQFIQQNLDN